MMFRFPVTMFIVAPGGDSKNLDGGTPHVPTLAEIDHHENRPFPKPLLEVES